jgi:diguanylate cyclase (GGDEF)-like protein/PAS domain S-box-containing protein
MEEKNRKTGIDFVGDVPWGTHFCQFYQTKQDLIDILVPYFKAGLESNEFCIWITSETLGEEEAKEAMRKAVPDFDLGLKKGQIEIIPYTEWYLKDGSFNLQRVLKGWVDKLEQALARGYDGMRLTGNIAWLGKGDWRSFTDYEEEVSNIIGSYLMLAICTLSLDKCGAFELVDIVSKHQFAIIKQEGKWALIESSERRQAQNALRQSEERCRELIENIPDVVWTTDQQGNTIYISSKVEEIYGYTPQEIYEAGEALWFGRIHPEDRERVKQGYAALLKLKKMFDVEYRIQRKDGKWIWLYDRAIATYERNGVMYANGIFTDITEQKLAEEAFERLRHRNELILNSAGEGILGLDLYGNHTFVNPSAARMLGYKVEELIGRSSHTIWHHSKADGNLYPVEECPIYAAYKDGAVRHRTDEVFWRKDGGSFPVEYTSTPILEDGRLAGAVVTFRDITERRRADEALRTLLLIDELTGLYNRRGFLTFAKQQLNIAARMNKGMLLLYADVDDLKWINDTLGHQEGDRALLETAEILKKAFRESDIIARISGDEFVVLAQEVHEGDAEILADRLQKELENRNAKSKIGYKLSISAGLARNDPENLCSIDELLKRADKLMYEQKRKKQR